MFKKIFFPMLALIFLSSPALAIDFWAGVEKAAVGEPVRVFQGMGDGFPKSEEIKAETYADRYEPITMVGANGEVKLKKGNSGESFVTEEPLSAGSYYVLAESVVGFASRTPTGVVRKSKFEDPTVTTCSHGGNFGKTLINLEPAGEDSFVAKPVGQKLEIVPQVNPSKVKVGEKFPVKVLYDGKPLASATVGAFFAGFTEGNKSLAFSSQTDAEGLVEIIPLRPGQWLAKVSRSGAYSDPKVCDRETYAASFAFTISE
jgi:uncharacterized GH25 family protein